MNVHPAIQGSITTSDASLLDKIEAEFPSVDNVRLGNEMTVSRRENDDGTETLTARMTFETGLQGKAAAEYLFERVNSHPLANGEAYQLRLYRTPEGGVTASDVEAWYQEHPDQQPTDADGDAFVPTSWNPEHHIIDEA